MIEGFFPSRALAGRRIVITAGPTLEPIDPVRFISNHSSGKMGFALAQAAAEAGATTVLISGPVALTTPAGVIRIDVQTAADMLEACREQLQDKTDLFIGSAAVADYRPQICEAQKIKKSGDAMSLPLVRNPDIISAVAMMTPRPGKVVGFAAETQDMLDHAKAKRLSKQLDAIVANDVSRSDIGFDSDANAVTWIDGEATVSIPITTKQNLARVLMERCALMLAHGKNESGQKQTGASG